LSHVTKRRIVIAAASLVWLTASWAYLGYPLSHTVS
jgi:hypothetical protein